MALQATAEDGKKTSAVVVLVEGMLARTANLAKHLPSGAVLAFQALSPSFSDGGACRYASNRYLTGALVCSCIAACALFPFTDSLRGEDGKLYYGVATPKGLCILNYDDEGEGGGRSKLAVLGDLRRYRLRIVDGVHAVLAVVVFLAVAMGDADVRSCFFSGAGARARQLLENLSVGAGVVSSIVFMAFPTTRKGIGYSGDHVEHRRN